MLGFMVTPQMRQRALPYSWWAADNGRFSAPEKYTDAGYLRWLQEQDRERCLFATAPDVLGDHKATVALSVPTFAAIRAVGCRPAFVAQDGWSDHDTPWDAFDTLFIGGTTAFKLGTGLLAAQIGRLRNKQVHMGRVNSLKRFLLARQAGCQSVDGTYLKYGPATNLPKLLSWFKTLETTPCTALFDSFVA